MSVNYSRIVIEDSSEANSMSENEDRNETSDVDGGVSDVDGSIREVASPEPSQIPIMMATTPSMPKKRGHPSKSESKRARLSALYHGASNSIEIDTNGVASESYVIQPVTPNKPNKRGRQPKADSEKNNRTKGALRIALGLKPAKIRRTEATLPSNEASPFPLVQQTDSVKKSRGRPRIHPPKDTSVKRPRGRPRLVPLEGEEALRNACLKLKRDCTKKDAVIKKLTERLKEFGHPVDDILQETKIISQQTDESEDRNKEENEVSDDGRTTPEPSSMEDTHQTYIGMFADNENKDKEDSGSESE